MPNTSRGLLTILTLLLAAPCLAEELPCTPTIVSDLTWDGTTVPHLAQGDAALTAFDGHGLPPRVLSLTFDDGPSRPSPDATLGISTYLHQLGLRATFFVATGPHTGHPVFNGCPSCPDKAPWWPLNDVPDLTALATVASQGHRIANHTHNHFPLYSIRGWFSDPAAQLSATREAVCLTQSVVDQYVTDGVYLLRPPYGDWDQHGFSVSDVLRADQRLNKVVGPVIWRYKADGGAPPPNGRGTYADDWNCARLGYEPSECGDALLSQIGTNGHGIVLLHDWIWRNPGNCTAPGFDRDLSCNEPRCRFAENLVRHVVPKLRESGYLFLPVEADPAFPGGMLFGTAAPRTTPPLFSDQHGWQSDPSYYRTFRLGDLDGDGKDDVCARSSVGMYCGLTRDGAFATIGPWQPDGTTAFSNARGWASEAYSSTIQLGDVDGDGRDDVCGANDEGVFCAISKGDHFDPPTRWLLRTQLPDKFFQYAHYYGTLRLAKVATQSGSREDLCFRAPEGVLCAVNLGNGFGTPETWAALFNDDGGGWNAPYYGETLAFGDLNADGRDDVCARGAAGLYCGLSTGVAAVQNTGGFNTVGQWSKGGNFGNLDWFWQSRGYYGTFRLGDVDGDGRADACIRSSAGFLCAQSLGNSFEAYRVWQKMDFRDYDPVTGLPTVWQDVPNPPNPPLAPYSSTVMLGDVSGDNRADICARTTTGIVCSVSGGPAE